MYPLFHSLRRRLSRWLRAVLARVTEWAHDEASVAAPPPDAATERPPQHWIELVRDRAPSLLDQHDLARTDALHVHRHGRPGSTHERRPRPMTHIAPRRVARHGIRSVRRRTGQLLHRAAIVAAGDEPAAADDHVLPPGDRGHVDERGTDTRSWPIVSADAVVARSTSTAAASQIRFRPRSSTVDDAHGVSGPTVRPLVRPHIGALPSHRAFAQHQNSIIASPIIRATDTPDPTMGVLGDTAPVSVFDASPASWVTLPRSGRPVVHPSGSYAWPDLPVSDLDTLQPAGRVAAAELSTTARDRWLAEIDEA